MPVVTRRAMHDLVWTKPVRDVAKDFGISDVGLKKICLRFDVPAPERGYWARLAAGKTVLKRKLPPRGPGMSDHIEIGPQPQRYFYKPTDYQIEEQLAEPEPIEPVFDEAIESVEARVRALVGKVTNIRTLDTVCAPVRKLLDGRQVRYVRDAQSRITAVDTRASSGGSWTSAASSVSWKPFGPLAALTFGNGLNLTLGYDQNYWLTAIDTAQGGTTTLDLDIGRNADGRVASITDNVSSSRSEAYTYTNSARLASGSGAWGSKSWTYDAAGNRTAESSTVSSVTTNDVYNYGSTSNRLNSIYTDPSGTTLKRSFSYRANGQTSQDVRVGDGTYDYTFTNDGRLSEVKKASTTLAVYGYDSDGRRVTRAVAGGITRDYVYSASGRLLAEADASGATVRDYLWLEDLPLAVVDSGSTYYVHAGQRGEPLAMTDGSKAKVWDAVVEPFGAAQIFTATVAMDRRLPGQDLQAETALSQNGQRDYDPAIGRYIEPDPIGLDGGPHVYSYVGQDPLNAIDPEGTFAGSIAVHVARLVVPQIARAVGVAVGAAAAGGDTPKAPESKTCPGEEPPDCAKEWRDARDQCRADFIAEGKSFDPAKIEECARGYVSEACGGNPLDRGTPGSHSWQKSADKKINRALYGPKGPRKR